jgi:hypothetical protein
MRSQVGFEQFAALALFIFSISFLIYQLLSYYPTYVNEVRRQTLISETYQTSEILTNDVGEPANWYSIPLDNVKRIGLLNETINITNVVSILKVFKANETCNTDYARFKKLLDLKNDINFVVYLEGRVLANCSYPFGEKVAKVLRIVSFDNRSYGELIIWLY